MVSVLTKEANTPKNPKKCLEAMDTCSSSLVVVMLSQVDTYVRIHPAVYIKCVPFVRE